MMRRIAIWAGSFFVVSTITFGVCFGSFGIITASQSGDSYPLDISAVGLFVVYGMFHWALLSTITFPIFLAPVLVWPFVARLLPVVESSRSSMIIGLSCMSVLAVLLRLGYLEYPALLVAPLGTLRAHMAAPSSYAEVIGTWSGLILPRLFLHNLASGSFVFHSRV